MFRIHTNDNILIGKEHEVVLLVLMCGLKM